MARAKANARLERMRRFVFVWFFMFYSFLFVFVRCWRVVRMNCPDNVETEAARRAAPASEGRRIDLIARLPPFDMVEGHCTA